MSLYNFQGVRIPVYREGRVSVVHPWTVRKLDTRSGTRCVDLQVDPFVLGSREVLSFPDDDPPRPFPPLPCRDRDGLQARVGGGPATSTRRAGDPSREACASPMRRPWSLWRSTTGAFALWISPSHRRVDSRETPAVGMGSSVRVPECPVGGGSGPAVTSVFSSSTTVGVSAGACSPGPRVTAPDPPLSPPSCPVHRVMGRSEVGSGDGVPGEWTRTSQFTVDQNPSPLCPVHPGKVYSVRQYQGLACYLHK